LISAAPSATRAIGRRSAKPPRASSPSWAGTDDVHPWQRARHIDRLQGVARGGQGRRKFIYFRGEGLSEVAAYAVLRGHSNAGKLMELQETTWKARERAHLVQRRVGKRLLEYIAVKASNVSG